MEVYRKFIENNLNQDLHNQLSSEQSKEHATFEKTFLSILEEHAPQKMRRSYLEKLYFKKRTPSPLKKHKKQKKYANKLFKKECKA